MKDLMEKYYNVIYYCAYKILFYFSYRLINPFYWLGLRNCFEFLQKVFLGLMCSFSCVLWTIFWSFPLLFFVR